MNPVEQQNSTYKTGYKKTAPNMNLVTAAKTITHKSRSTNHEKNVSYCEMVDESNLWSRSSTCDKIVQNIKGTISQLWNEKDKYEII